MDANAKRRQIHISEKMIGEGLREFLADRSFEHDWQVVMRIYAAMAAVDSQREK
jgi:hypothetical protein